MSNAIHIEDWNKVDSEVVKIRITPCGSITEMETKGIVRLAEKEKSFKHAFHGNLYRVFGINGENFGRSLYGYNSKTKSFYPVNFL